MKLEKGEAFVLGIDFGTDFRAGPVVADAADGVFAGSGVSHYGRWAEGKYCEPRENRFRQHPLDYIESMEEAVKAAIQEAAGAMRGRGGVWGAYRGRSPWPSHEDSGHRGGYNRFNALFRRCRRTPPCLGSSFRRRP